MTLEEAKKIFLNRGYIEAPGGIYYDGDKWREAITVISNWLEQEPCEDCVSRQSVLDALDKMDKALDNDRSVESYKELLTECYKDLPSVTPKEKIGHWIGHREHCEKLGLIPSGLGAYKWCSNCDCGIDINEWYINHYNFCPNCGARMEGE